MHTARRFRVPVVQPEAFTAQGLAMTAWAYAEVFAPADAPGASALLDEAAALAVARAALALVAARRGPNLDMLPPPVTGSAVAEEGAATAASSTPSPSEALRHVLRVATLRGRYVNEAFAPPTEPSSQLSAPSVVSALNGLSHALSHPQTLRTATPGQLATFARALATTWSELRVS